jgi:TonB family protein
VYTDTMPNRLLVLLVCSMPLGAALAQDAAALSRAQRDADNPLRMIIEAGRIKPRARPAEADKTAAREPERVQVRARLAAADAGPAPADAGPAAAAVKLPSADSAAGVPGPTVGSAAAPTSATASGTAATASPTAASPLPATSAPEPTPAPTVAPRPTVAPTLAPVLAAPPPPVPSTDPAAAPEPTAAPGPTASSGPATAPVPTDPSGPKTAPEPTTAAEPRREPESLVREVVVAAPAAPRSVVAETPTPLQLTNLVEPSVPRRLVGKVRGDVEVVVSFTVRPDGSVGSPSVQQSSNAAMNQAVLDAVAQWRYAPVDQPRQHAVQLLMRTGD